MNNVHANQLTCYVGEWVGKGGKWVTKMAEFFLSLTHGQVHFNGKYEAPFEVASILYCFLYC